MPLSSKPKKIFTSSSDLKMSLEMKFSFMKGVAKVHRLMSRFSAAERSLGS